MRATLGALAKNYEATPLAFEQWKRRFPGKRRHEGARRTGSRFGPEQEQLAPRLYERLKIHQNCTLDSHRPQCQQLMGFVQWWSREKFLEAGRGNLGIGHLQGSQGLSKKHGFSCLRFNKNNVRRRERQGQRNGGRSTAASDIDHPGNGLRYVFRRDHRLHEQAIDRRWALLRQVEPGEIHLLVPGRQQLEIHLELRRQRRRQSDTRTSGSAVQTGLKLATAHRSETVSAGSLPRYAPSTAIAAGVTPGIRDA